MIDNLDKAIESLRLTTIDLLKESFEYFGFDMGKTDNGINYINYLADNPISFNDKNIDQLLDILSNNGFESILNGSKDPGSTGLSDGMINFISFYETGHQFGYSMNNKDMHGYDLGDAGGHKTYGYGLLYHPSGKAFMDDIKKNWTQQELEILYKIKLKNTVDKVKKWAQSNNIELKQQQIDAIVSACFNFGDGFLTNKGKSYTETVNLIRQNPDNIKIKELWANMSNKQGVKFPGLIKRRQAEAYWYFT